MGSLAENSTGANSQAFAWQGYGEPAVRAWPGRLHQIDARLVKNKKIGYRKFTWLNKPSEL